MNLEELKKLADAATQKCVQCGATARFYLRPTNIMAQFHPYCGGCMNAEYAICEEIAQHEIQNFGGDYGIPNLEHKPIEFAEAIHALIAEIERLRGVLEFIANGCLVPPDGGSPRFEDAIEAARQALQQDKENV